MPSFFVDINKNKRIVIYINKRGKYMEDKTFIKARVTGTYTETEERIKSDQLLLNTIESERMERIEATKETFDKLKTLAIKEDAIYKELQNCKITLNTFLVVYTILLIVTMIVNW